MGKRIILLLPVFIFLLVACACGKEKGSSVVRIEVDKKVLDLINSWDKKICFFTSKDNPLRSLEGLKKEDIAAWGVELFKNVEDLYKVLGIEGGGVKFFGNINEIFSGMKNPLRLFITWAGFEPDLKGSVRVEFKERKSK
jgi:hypothetical protein